MNKNTPNDVIQTDDSRNKSGGSLNADEKKDCNISSNYSKTRYFKRNQITGEMQELTRKGLKRALESASGDSTVSSKPFNCEHLPKDKDYTEKSKLKIFLTKQIDPINIGIFFFIFDFLNTFVYCSDFRIPNLKSIANETFKKESAINCSAKERHVLIQEVYVHET